MGRYRAEESAEMIIWLLELRRIAHQSSEEDFWRTLVYNRDGKLRPATRSLGDSFGCVYMEAALLVEDHLTRDKPTPIGDWVVLLKLLAAGQPFRDAWSNLSNQRFFFVSEDGRIGWVPMTANPRDRLYVFKGMRVPVVIRPLQDTGWWQLVGACYIHGLMDGEAEDMAQDRWEWLKIL